MLGNMWMNLAWTMQVHGEKYRICQESGVNAHQAGAGKSAARVLAIILPRTVARAKGAAARSNGR